MSVVLKEEHQKLIEAQESCFDKIKSICTNYDKDGASRKTLEYLRIRINALDSHWTEFEQNDFALSMMGDKDLAYFTEEVFPKTKAMYERTKQKMSKLRDELTTNATGNTSQANLQETGAAAVTPAKREASGTFGLKNTANYEPFGHIDESSTERKDILLLKQQCNFKAFQRAYEKINLRTIAEKWDLEDKLNILKNKWESIDKIHWELDNLLKGTSPLYDQEYEKLENIYDDLRTSLNKKIWENMHYQKSTPKVDIPEFHGDYNQWVSFKDIFVETIHTNPMISNSQKMQHLKTKLKGEAEKLVQHLSVTADNYESCWEIIEHRYDNKRLLFSSYINTLLNQPTIQQFNSQNIKKLHDTTIECVNALHNIGLDLRTWDPIIVHLLVQKLDAATYENYVQCLENPRDFPVLEEFIKFLESKFMALETMRDHSATSSVSQNSKLSRNYNFDKKPMNFKQSEKWTKSYNTTVNYCPLCKKDHVLMNCNTFLDMHVNQRNLTVAKLNICRNCLYSHEGKKCSSQKKCKICNRFHHTFLHDANFRSQQYQH